MRPNLQKSLRQQFGRRLISSYPKFAGKGSGSRVSEYSWKVGEDLSIWVNLQVDSKMDSFMVMTGFGPTSGLTFEISYADRDKLAIEPGLVRLPYLVTQPYRDIWWDVDPMNYLTDPLYAFKPKTPEQDCLARIPALLDDVFAKLSQYAVPFWKEIARNIGVELHF